MGLQPRRKHKVLAERRRVFIDSESGAIGCDLEQHSARLEKVDRLEPEPVDDFGWPTPRTIDSLANFELRLVVGHSPSNVVHAAGSPATAIRISGFANLQIASGAATADRESLPLLLDSDVDEAQHAGEERRRQGEIALPQPYRMQTANLFLRWNGTVAPWSEFAVVAGLVQRQRQSVRIAEGDGRSPASRLDLPDGEMMLHQAIDPVVDRTEGNGERNFRRQTSALFSRRHFRPGEKGDVSARMSVAVGIEEMIRARRILIDALLHQSHSQHA